MQSFFRDLLTLLQTKNIPNNSFISAASQSLNSFIQLSIDNNQIHHETNTTFNITLFNESETYQYENSLIINKNTTSISNFLNEQLVLVSKQMEEQSLFFQSPLYLGLFLTLLVSGILLSISLNIFSQFFTLCLVVFNS